MSSILGAAMLTLSTVAEFPPAQEGIPVEIITDNQFSQITKGEKTAKEVQATPKPRADRVAEKIEQRDPGEDKRDAPAPPKRPEEMKVAEKEEPVAAQPPPPPPPPEARRDQGRYARRGRKEADRKGRSRSRRPEGRRGQSEGGSRRESQGRGGRQGEGEGRGGSEGQGGRRSQEARGSEGQGRSGGQGPQGSRSRQEARFRRHQAIARQQRKEPVHRRDRHRRCRRPPRSERRPGTPPKLSPSMEDALRGLLKEQIERCYNAPPGAMVATHGDSGSGREIQHGWDASRRSPGCCKSGSSSLDRAVADAALRAVRRCAPYNIPAKFAPYYSSWKHWNMHFEPPSV